MNTAQAEALESGARQLLAQADLAGAATRLQEAAGLWRGLNNDDRAARCLLLAASTWRLAGSFGASAEAVGQVKALALSPELARGFELERAELALARGHAAQAHAFMDAFLNRHRGQLEPLLHAQVLQRRAAAATAAHYWPQAASDFSAAAELLQTGGRAADAEAARLAGAAVLSHWDTLAAESAWDELVEAPASDGAAAARRGLVGGHIALLRGDLHAAVQRFDAARQGALDARDALSYLAASQHAADVLVELDLAQQAYARLATAWATLGDLLGREAAADLVRPPLLRLRERLGEQAFMRVREGYEATRRGV
ncbi:MAG: hypothetical protein Q8N06_20435 [Hydrogenophaga sp.]|nr:hypothetical protein [Hydrogenophaga sp.]